MATILFYSPFYRRARDVESLMIYLKNKGHHVLSLSQREGVEFNPHLKMQGIEAYSYLVPRDGSLLFFIRHIFYFIKFCRSHRIDFVFSHLDPANFVASIGQYFINARVFLCRHHINEASLYNYHLSWTYRLTNKLARKVIVVSEASERYMVEHEGVKRTKLIHINLAYDFALYGLPDPVRVNAIRSNLQSVVLVTACRLTKFKRPELSIAVLQKLMRANVSAHLVLLGAGEMLDDLKNIVATQGLSNNVTFMGHITNALEYLAAADYVIHPSVLESSCVVIKEAGIVKKPVIVCKGIGDFNDFIRNDINGFLVNQDEFVDQTFGIILKTYQNHSFLNSIGLKLHEAVNNLFNIDNIGVKYEALLEQK